MPARSHFDMHVNSLYYPQYLWEQKYGIYVSANTGKLEPGH